MMIRFIDNAMSVLAGVAIAIQLKHHGFSNVEIMCVVGGICLMAVSESRRRRG